MTEHTPGPWDVDTDMQNQAHVVSDATGSIITEFDGEGGAVQLANARLIAAAPDLLAALEDMTGTAQGLIVSHKVHTFYPGDEGRLADQIERAEIKLTQARAAIAKARQ